MRVLVVEDDEVDFEIVRRCLAGWVCVHANCAAAGMVEIRKGGFDWVLVDLGLPDSVGVAFVEMVGAIAGCPVQGMSGAPRDGAIGKDAASIQEASRRIKEKHS